MKKVETPSEFKLITSKLNYYERSIACPIELKAGNSVIYKDTTEAIETLLRFLKSRESLESSGKYGTADNIESQVLITCSCGIWECGGFASTIESKNDSLLFNSRKGTLGAKEYTSSIPNFIVTRSSYYREIDNFEKKLVNFVRGLSPPEVIEIVKMIKKCIPYVKLGNEESERLLAVFNKL